MNNRDTNIELLRLVLMSFIVLWHFLVHGMGLLSDNAYCNGGDIPMTHIIVMALICYHVDCFVFISGYYGVSLSLKKIIFLLTQVIFYSVCTYFTAKYLFGQPLSIDFWKLFFPISTDMYWFFTDYFWLILLCPFLNECERVGKSRMMFIIILLFIVYIGGVRYVLDMINLRFCLFVFLYLLGRYLRKYPFGNRTFYIWLWFLSIFLLIIAVFLYFSRGILGAGNVNHLLTNVNPIVISAAVSFFYIFQGFRIKSVKLINWFASGCFAVYLMTDGPFMPFYNKVVLSIFGTNVAVLICISVIIVLTISMVENMRNKVFSPINNLCLRTIMKIKCLCDESRLFR